MLMSISSTWLSITIDERREMKRLFELLMYWLKPTSERAAIEIIIASVYLSDDHVFELTEYFIALDEFNKRKMKGE
jgi:hypothetical protein